MGYNKFNLKLIHDIIDNNNNVKEFLELGNQYINNTELDIDERVGKIYFTKLGYNHTSIDWNGQDGAIKMDLTKDIDEEYIGKFDIVTNAGTTEHIRGQYTVFKNLHNFGKETCFYVNSLPLDTNQNQELYNRRTNPHGLYEYNTKFFELLCESCNYEIIDINTDIGVWGGNHFCNATYKKTKDSYFISQENFKELMSHIIFYKNGSAK